MSVRRLAPKELQPASFAFTAENLAWAKAAMEKYPPGRQQSAVIPVLWRAQEQNEGWVSEAVIRVVADLLGMAYIRVLENATFYTMFQLQPVGKKAHVQVCGTTPCMLRGAKDIIDVCKHRIHHDPFHLSDDGNFSWEEVECLGACVNAPMAMIWKDTYEDLTAENFGKVLDGFASGNQVKPGPQAGRQFAAPEGGPRVLTTNPNAPANDKGTPNKPVLTDADAKRPTASASERDAPAPSPKSPIGDSTKTKPPKGDKS